MFIIFGVVGIFISSFVFTIFFGAIVSIDVVFNLIVGAYGLMAIPTMTATLILSPRVMQEARSYFSRPQLTRSQLLATRESRP